MDNVCVSARRRIHTDVKYTFLEDRRANRRTMRTPLAAIIRDAIDLEHRRQKIPLAIDTSLSEQEAYRSVGVYYNLQYDEAARRSAPINCGIDAIR